LQNELWAAVVVPAGAQPNPVMALVVSGMNDVLNSQGYTQAAYWNRIPTAAWMLMVTIAIVCNLLVGYGSRSLKLGSRLLPILPMIVAVAFMLIADIDAPRHGIIRVLPQNLISLAESLRHPVPM
jgi:sugar phosphate permease